MPEPDTKIHHAVKATADPIPQAGGTATEKAPAPDEDDLDDLDDMLDEFSTTQSPHEHPKKETEPGRPGLTEKEDAVDFADDFSAQLQKEMAALMDGVNESPEMRSQLEVILKELGAAAASQPADDKAEGASKAPVSRPEEAFQDTVRRTMERMQVSENQATAAAASDEGEDLLAQMMEKMQGTGPDEDISKMLMGMMEQLTNKEILYEPMKELHDKYPGWMKKNKDKTSADDLARYTEQQSLVAEIVARFERKGYSDENSGDREFIVERMQKMQAAGSPPSDLVGDMKDAQEVLGDLDAGCPQQ